MVRVVGRELARRGFDVHAITWSEPGLGSEFEVDGITIHAYPYTYTSKSVLRHLIDYAKVVPIIKKVNADVYISIDCMVETLIAQKVMPRAKHVIWVQDPFDWNDYMLLSSIDPNYRVSRLKFWATTKLYEVAYKRADMILTQARYYIPKIARLYHVDPSRVIYLPNPVEHIPEESSIRKTDEPLVCFLGRMDPQKRYWLFFELAKRFPDIEFVAVGRPSILYEDMYKRIVSRYANLRNLRILGFVSEEKKQEMLNRCWILVLPSIREGLPIAFLEALAHKCALLSTVNPDNIVERFGYYVSDEDPIKGLSRGLKSLLDNDSWREKGNRGYHYVRSIHSLDLIINRLIQLLKGLS